jgi:hypothetical protein
MEILIQGIHRHDQTFAGDAVTAGTMTVKETCRFLRWSHR